MTKPYAVKRENLADFIVKHVGYELESIAAAYRIAGTYQSDRPEHRVAVETFLLHARNLDEFFTKGPSPKYVVAVNAAAQWPLTEEESHVVPAGRRGPLSSMLVHIGALREVHVGTAWNLTEIAKLIEQVARRWAAALDLPNDAFARTEVVRRCDEIKTVVEELGGHPAAVTTAPAEATITTKTNP